MDPQLGHEVFQNEGVLPQALNRMDRHAANEPVQKMGDRDIHQAPEHRKEGSLAVKQQGKDIALPVPQ
ncbi:hypothetical protein AGMMS49546_16570 [Spirochaetia bacterium]|nr:hypothetical protein AGMMS49546_16570 [Spirochaetia bacterium]